MIVLDCEQGSREWIEARLGIPTASMFSQIVTPGGKLSASRGPYMGKLLAEWALGEPVDNFESDWMERGKFLEAEAFKYYGFVTESKPKKVGFVYKDDARMVGCSPDGLVPCRGPEVEGGTLELKCPSPGEHLMYLAGGVCPKKYVPQVQGEIWVTGALWGDFMSYHPGLPPFLIRVEPDPKYQAALDGHIEEFTEELLAGRDRLRELGVVPVSEIEVEEKERGSILTESIFARREA